MYGKHPRFRHIVILLHFPGLICFSPEMKSSWEKLEPLPPLTTLVRVGTRGLRILSPASTRFQDKAVMLLSFIDPIGHSYVSEQRKEHGKRKSFVKLT